MTFFQKPSPPRTDTAGSSWTPPKQTSVRGDRMLAVRVATPDLPDHRVPAETLEGRGKVGLTNARVLERLPRGCLFKVGTGWFDLDGYWCLPRGDGKVEVRRGSTKRVMRALTEAQRRELERVRLNARRHGVR